MSEKKLSISYKAKQTLVQTSLVALGVAFEMVSKEHKGMQEELKSWDAGRVFSVGVLPNGPAMTVKKDGPRLVYVGRGHQNPHMKILFKNLDSAVMIMTGQMSAHTAFAEHRAIVHGALSQAVEANRVMAIAQKFLFPDIMLKKLFKNPPTYTFSELMLKGKVYALIGGALAMNIRK